MIKIKRVENVQCLLDVFQTEPHGPGVVSLSAHVLCFESQHTQVTWCSKLNVFHPLFCLCI